MKKFSKVLAVLVIMLLGLTSTGVTAYASPTDPQPGGDTTDPTPTPTPTTPPIPGVDSKYEELGGTNTGFTKYLITNQGQVIHDITFTYKIEPGTAVPAKDAEAEHWDYAGQPYASKTDAEAAAVESVTQDDTTGKWGYAGKDFNYDTKEEAEAVAKSHVQHHPAVEGLFEIFAGIGTPTFTNNAQFNANGGVDTGYTGIWTEVQTGDTLDSTLLTEGKQYSKDGVTIDFTSVKFTEPGVYRYIITELPVEGVESIEYDIEQGGSMKRVLDVYVVDDPENPGELKIMDNGYVLHNTVSSIKTTEEMGSKDENIVASGWQISDDPTHTYNDYDEALEELARRRSMPIDAPNYDSDILAKQAEIDAKQAEIDAKQEEYNDAADELDPPLGTETDTEAGTLYGNQYVAQQALNVLENGENPKPTKTIEQLIAELTSATDETNDAVLAQFGKNDLMAALNTATDAKSITVLRRVIDDLNDSIATAEAALRGATDALMTALNSLQSIQDEIDTLNLEKDDLVDELADLVEKHVNATIIEVEWRLSDKSDHYTNRISVYDLEFGKEVEGNQGSKDKYFKFTLTLTGLTVAKEYYRPIEAGETADATADGTDKYKDAEGNVIANGTEVKKVTIKPTTLTINEADPNASIWTKAPSKTRSTIYESKDMTEANSRDDDRDLVFSEATDEKEQQRLVWDDASEPNVTYKYNRTDKKWQRYEDGVLDPEWTGTTPPDNATHTGLPGQQLIAEDGVITWDVYLKDGEYINFKDLPAGITYEVVEDEEDYAKTVGTDKVVSTVYVFDGQEYSTKVAAETAAKGSVTGNDDDGYTFPGSKEPPYETRQLAEEAAAAAVVTETKVHDDPTSGTLSKSVYTGYTNTRDGILPTGIMIAATAGLAMLGIGAAGMFLFGKRKEEDEEEDEE